MGKEKDINFPPAIMFLGTTSNAGKSVLTAGLCRVLARKGFAVAPFKAQNMALNSWVTGSGGEMGIAQAVQARACGLEPDASMNPVLLKPFGAGTSQVILLGKPLGTMAYADYVGLKPRLWKEIRAAYAELCSGKEIMVLEGAGSPAEINLRKHDIVNLRMAAHAGARGILVADIDRGGAFAGLAGTMTLLSPRDRKLIAAFTLNKFRGDSTLLTPALDQISRRFHRPFAGIIPHIPDLRLPDEDSVTLAEKPAGNSTAHEPDCLDVAVIDLPAISNITDWDPLLAEPRVRVRMVKSASQLGSPHIALIPGSRNVPACIRHLRQTGLDQALRDLAQAMRGKGAGQVVGICAGLQILGETLIDAHGLEAASGEHPCLGLLPLATSLEKHKILRRQIATASPGLCGAHLPCFGQEIHHGQCETQMPPIITGQEGTPLGWSAEEPARVWGTWLHGIFESDLFRHAWLNRVASEFGLEPLASSRYSPDTELDRLADIVEENLDMKLLLSWLAP